MLKNYTFLEATISICNECNKKVGAKIILEDDKIFIVKNCLKHGKQKELMEEYAKYYFMKKPYDKPGTTCKTQTMIKNGCPFDCGLCPDHEQHTCIGLLEITDKCNLGCPTCYANSGEGEFMNLKDINNILDFYIDSENGYAEILQISGGEPTIHPQIFDILKLAKSKDIKYIMLNTNGLIIAQDENFAKKLSEIFPDGGFEVYLQFDSVSVEGSFPMRGKNMQEIRKKAIENLEKYNIAITLVTTVVNNVNDNEIGKIIEFGLNKKNIRGINFQPVAYFGRISQKDRKNRVTLSGVLQRIENQTKKLIKFDDFLPLPCDVDRIAITFLHKKNNTWTPITRDIALESYLPAIDNTINFEMESLVEKSKKLVFKCSGKGGCIKSVSEISKIIDPKILLKSKKEKRRYIDENFFRITVTSFIDIYNFDIKSVKKDCVHILTKDKKKMPFSTFNMFYRK